MNALVQVPVVVLGKVWLDGDNDPPTLELRLSSGAYVKVGWDLTYHHRLLWWAPDGESDFVTCTAERTGLGDELGPIEDEVFRAVECFESNLRAEYASDEHNYSDGRDG